MSEMTGNTEYLAEGRSLRLRPMRFEDCADVIRFRNEEHVRKNYIYMEKLTLEEEERYFREKVETGRVLHLMICEKAEADRPVGCVVFNDMVSFLADPEGIPAEMGLFLGESSSVGRGYGKEAMYIACDYAFRCRGVRRLVSRIFTDNTASVNALLRCGFEIRETLPGVLRSNGTRKDMYLLEVTPGMLHPPYGDSNAQEDDEHRAGSDDPEKRNAE